VTGCGPDAGTGAAVARHRKAREPSCLPCAEYARLYQQQRRQRPEVRARDRRDARIRERAMRALIAAHPDQWRSLLTWARQVEDGQAAS
jgi:hypothetical protein